MVTTERGEKKDREPLATYFLILAEIITFALMETLAAPDVIYSLFGFSASGLQQGRVWTIVSSLFVHASFYHLAVNMFLLYVFGTSLEKQERNGWKTLLSVFFVSGAISLLIGINLYPAGEKIIGSSVAVSGLAGAVLIRAPSRRSPFFLLHAPIGLVSTIYLIFNAFFAYYVGTAQGIAYPSHVIGFFVGIGITLLATRIFSTWSTK